MNRKSTTLISLGISVALIAVGIWYLTTSHLNFGFGNTTWYMPQHMSWMGGGAMGGGAGMGFVMIVFWVAVIAALVLMVSGALTVRRPPENHSLHESDALNILKQRYARGEIDKEQFDAMRRDIE